MDEPKMSKKERAPAPKTKILKKRRENRVTSSLDLLLERYAKLEIEIEQLEKKADGALREVDDRRVPPSNATFARCVLRKKGVDNPTLGERRRYADMIRKRRDRLLKKSAPQPVIAHDPAATAVRAPAKKT